MHIEEIVEKINPIDKKYVHQAQERFDQLIKPLGSLAKLEEMTSRYAGIVEKTDKNELDYPKKMLLVWCDIQQAATVEQIMAGKLPVNVLAEETSAVVYPIVVTSDNKEDALNEGAALVQELIRKHTVELLGFGSLSEQSNVVSAMCGGMLQAAAMKIPVVLDGKATCMAAVQAVTYTAHIKDYLFAGHVSEESGMENLLENLGLSASLRLEISDGAGAGAAMAFTLFDAGLRAYKEMETFEEAGVHAEMKEFSLHEQKKKGQ